MPVGNGKVLQALSGIFDLDPNAFHNNNEYIEIFDKRVVGYLNSGEKFNATSAAYIEDGSITGQCQIMTVKMVIFESKSGTSCEPDLSKYINFAEFKVNACIPASGVAIDDKWVYFGLRENKISNILYDDSFYVQIETFLDNGLSQIDFGCFDVGDKYDACF